MLKPVVIRFCLAYDACLVILLLLLRLDDCASWQGIRARDRRFRSWGVLCSMYSMPSRPCERVCPNLSRFHSAMLTVSRSPGFVMM